MKHKKICLEILIKMRFLIFSSPCSKFLTLVDRTEIITHNKTLKNNYATGMNGISLRNKYFVRMFDRDISI